MGGTACLVQQARADADGVIDNVQHAMAHIHGHQLSQLRMLAHSSSRCKLHRCSAGCQAGKGPPLMQLFLAGAYLVSSHNIAAQWPASHLQGMMLGL